jgi:hypothetical protein
VLDYCVLDPLSPLEVAEPTAATVVRGNGNERARRSGLGRAEGQFDFVETVRMFVQQISEVGSRLKCGRNG